MIDEHGRLAISLYHGTSSIFLDSINEHGLGGHRDSQIFNLNVLKLLAESLNDPKNQTEWWELNSPLIEQMLEQSVTRGGFNFRYGGTYLTPSKSTARSYAINNCLGSEFLSTIYESFMALKSVNSLEADRIIPVNHSLRAIFQKEHGPVLVTLMNISAELLKTEQGEYIQDQLNSMVDIKNSVAGVDPEILWQQFNFELTGVIDSKFLNITYLN
jgi:hypothetical protein